MKKSISLGVCILVFVPVVAMAHDVFAPEWRGLEGTTYQQWRFDSPANPAVPEVITNDYGSASASITVGLMGSGWTGISMMGTQTGVWDIGGSDGQIIIDIDNRPLPLPYKEIRLQITYYQSMTAEPTVFISGAELVSSQTALIEEDGVFGSWYLQQSVWGMTPNPSHEQIVITGDSTGGSVIDAIVVDTYCIPEPATVAMLTLGSFAIFWKRRQ